MHRILLSGVFFCFTLRCFGALTVELGANPMAPQPVGTPILFTAIGSDSRPGNLDYRFSASRGTKPARVIQDFGISNRMVWAVTSSEGAYTVQVTARNLNTGETAVATLPLQVVSRVQGNIPVISATENPLVALYSAPSCPDGSFMYVRFGAGSGSSQTNALPCTPGLSMNFYIAGMLPNTTYTMLYVVVTGSNSQPGPPQQFTTGRIDPGLTFPSISILTPPNGQSSSAQGVLLMDFLPSGGQAPYYFPTAIDLQGRVIWYYPKLGVAAEQSSAYIRPVPKSNGNMLIIVEDPNTETSGQILREIDLAGNMVQQTSVSRVSEQLNRLGRLGITDFDHDAIRLPNGHTIVISTQEQIYPPGTQGSTGPVDIIGDAIVDLDSNLQLSWSWSAFDHLDINRAAILGETCVSEGPGCPPLYLAAVANDWLHANSLDYSAASGDILLSLRHQDWVAKIDYANGAGTGNVIWELGADGSFTINSNDPAPWFSHQHDAQFELGGTNILSLFDNGNTRFVANPGLLENSRGYVLNVDEVNRVATPVLLTDLGVYSGAVGSAQRLENGNYHFEAGAIGIPPNYIAQAAEVLPNGTLNFQQQDNTITYRSYRMESLYIIDHTQR